MESQGGHAVFQCLKGSRVAATKLLGDKCQESSTEVSQGYPIWQKTSLPEGTPISEMCKQSQNDMYLGGCERISVLRGRLH